MTPQKLSVNAPYVENSNAGEGPQYLCYDEQEKSGQGNVPGTQEPERHSWVDMCTRNVTQRLKRKE